MHTHTEQVWRYLFINSLEPPSLAVVGTALQLLGSVPGCPSCNFCPMFSNLLQFWQFSTPACRPRYVLVKSPWSESCAHMTAQSSHLCLSSQFVLVSGMLVPQKFMQTVSCRRCVWAEGQTWLSLLSSFSCQSHPASPNSCLLSWDPLIVFSTVCKLQNKHK